MEKPFRVLQPYDFVVLVGVGAYLLLVIAESGVLTAVKAALWITACTAIGWLLGRRLYGVQGPDIPDTGKPDIRRGPGRDAI